MVLDPNQPHYAIAIIIGVIFVFVVIAFVAIMCRRKSPDHYEGEKSIS